MHTRDPPPDISFYRSTFGRRAFPVAGQTFWNSLADEPSLLK